MQVKASFSGFHLVTDHLPAPPAGFRSLGGAVEGPLHSRARWASGQLSKPGLNLPVRLQGKPQLRGRALLSGFLSPPTSLLSRPSSKRATKQNSLNSRLSVSAETAGQGMWPRPEDRGDRATRSQATRRRREGGIGGEMDIPRRSRGIRCHPPGSAQQMALAGRHPHSLGGTTRLSSVP